MLELNSRLPVFSLPAQDDKTYTDDDFKGSKLVLYFYPKANTPGWTSEAVSFRDSQEALEELGVKIVGVSKDSINSQKKFADKNNLTFPLLADTEAELCEKFGVLNLIGIIKRSTFIFDEDGILIKKYEKVKNPGQHGEEVLEFLKQS